ncbi:DUF4340 domain-containing protein [Desulfonema magnum]|uniref:DUF4340 n=1 Tax=Desulfonema magnum TaxID=45655 RepID=A0A975BF81_9BACT|nr:DUF4340 domain-containing protein [Desulfonema magnum]QTA84317.1 DUF4340 [Desulfonema magnum]
MKLKTFVILLVVCCALGGVAYFTMYQKETENKQVKMGEKLFPDFPVNDVAAITIKSHEDSVALKKGEPVWVVENRFNYPADFSKITDIVKKLKDSKLGRSFKADDEKRSRLALYGPEKEDMPEDQRGTRLTLEDKKKKILADIILGNPREGGGHYVMHANADDVYMVDQIFSFLDKKPDEWLDKELTEAKSNDVEKVVCTDPKSEKVIYTLKRPEKGKDPEFANLPEGKKLKKSKANSLFGAIGSFRIEDVADPAKEAGETGLDNALCFEYHMFDGTVYKVYPGTALNNDNDKFYLKMSAAYVAKEKKEEEKKQGEEEKAVADEETSKPEETEKNEVELSAEAEKLNKRISPWIYIVSKWRHDNFVADPEEFFEEQEVKKEESSDQVKKLEVEAGKPELQVIPKAELESPEPKVTSEAKTEKSEAKTETPKAEAEAVKSETESETESQAETQKAEAENQKPKVENQKPKIGIQPSE